MDFSAKPRDLGLLLSLVDLRSFVEIMLLGKSSQLVRVAAAHFIKSLFQQESQQNDLIVEIFLEKIESFSVAGINASEYLAVFGFICAFQARNG